MKDIYKPVKLYMGYLKYLCSNPNSNFDGYLKYVMKNKEILEEYINNGDTNAFRIVNISFLKTSKGVMIQPTSIFLRPDGMSQEDAIKVISFAYKYMVQFDSPRVINILEIILTRRFGFKPLNSVDYENTVDLFLTDDLLNFINSKYFDRYFSWFDDNVGFEDIYNIYRDIDSNVVKRLKKYYYYKPVK